MRSNTIISKFHFLSLSVAALALLAESSSASNWSQFRGPNCSGTLVDAYPPVEISPTNGVLWNIEVPWSPSSPCLWDDRIFLTTYLDGELQTRAYSRNKGRLLWNRSVKPERLEVYHNSEGSPAASTPVADGKRVVSYFG
jgi:outer membrane protein assembly factor BamB